MAQISPDGGASWQDVVPSPAYQGTIDGAVNNCNPTPKTEGKQGWSGTIPGGAWTQVTVPIPQNLRTADFRLRFLFGSDPDTRDDGWLIDDIAIVTP